MMVRLPVSRAPQASTGAADSVLTTLAIVNAAGGLPTPARRTEEIGGVILLPQEAGLAALGEAAGGLFVQLLT